MRITLKNRQNTHIKLLEIVLYEIELGLASTSVTKDLLEDLLCANIGYGFASIGEVLFSELVPRLCWKCSDLELYDTLDAIQTIDLAPHPCYFQMLHMLLSPNCRNIGRIL